jgi:hypothetical protein
MKFTICLLAALASQGRVSASSLTAHEWGTYTSCAGSDGRPQPGMQHGEEPLPSFVHSRSDTYTKEMFMASQLRLKAKAKGNARTTRHLLGIDPPAPLTKDTPFGCHYCTVLDYEPIAGTPTEVTQKLETPVVYFYTKEPVHVSLNVSFPQGIVTQVYPDTTANLPPIGQVEKTAEGLASWEVDVAPEGTVLPVPEVPADDIWVPSRQVDANFVTNTAGENERHVFYRGLGRFDVPVRVTSTNTTLSVVNEGAEPLSAAFLFDSDGVNGGTVQALGSVAAGGSVAAPLRPHQKDLSDAATFLSMNEYLSTAKQVLLASLVEAGLYPKEAQAMVDTWTKSYFLSSGVRVLYVVPREWTDELLPLTMHPTPEHLERVLVGRVEVLTAAAEQELLAAVTRLTRAEYTNVHQMMDDQSMIKDLDRFAEAKLRRVMQLTTDKDVHAAIRGLFTQLTY